MIMVKKDDQIFNIAESLMPVLKPDLTDNKDCIALVKVANLLLQCGTSDQINKMIDLFCTSNFNQSVKIQSFYEWLYQHHFNAKDIQVYEHFKDSCEKSGVKCTANPTIFCGDGSILYDWLDSWRAESTTTMTKILTDFFTQAVKEVKGFNVAILHTPKSLLRDYGIGIFINYIESTYGGAHHYLSATQKEIDTAADEFKKLDAIHQRRSAALLKGDLKKFDKIGALMSDKGITGGSNELNK